MEQQCMGCETPVTIVRANSSKWCKVCKASHEKHRTRCAWHKRKIEKTEPVRTVERLLEIADRLRERRTPRWRH